MKNIAFILLLFSAFAFSQSQIPAEVRTFNYPEGKNSKLMMNKTDWFIAFIPMLKVEITNAVKADNGFSFTALQTIDNSDEFVSSDITYQFLEKSYSVSAHNFRLYNSITLENRPLDSSKETEILEIVRGTFFDYWQEVLTE